MRFFHIFECSGSFLYPHFSIVYFHFEGSHNTTHEPKSTYHLCLYNLQDKNGFHIFKWLKKVKRRALFQNTWKFYEMQILLPIDKVLLEYSIFIYLCISCDSFHVTTAELRSCYRQRIAYKTKIFTIWPSIKSLPTHVLCECTTIYLFDYREASG